jgi:hypothetical protein
MKGFVLAAVVAVLLCAAVDGFYGEIFSDFPFGDDDDCGGAEGCVCITSATGRHANRNTCNGVTGAKTIGCAGTNKYLECNGAACTSNNCTTGQVWSMKTQACAACSSDQQVRSDLQVCVCKTGFKKNHTTGMCNIPCPTNSNILPDSCKCPSATPLVFKHADGTSECRACPSGTTMRDGTCKCASANPPLYWQASSWSCIGCPGTAQNITIGRGHYSMIIEICNCTAPNAIFDVEGVQCYTCPASTTAMADAFCKCPIRGQEFSKESQSCKCGKNSVVNTATNSCEWQEPPSTPAVTGAPVVSTPSTAAANAGGANNNP